MWRTLHQAAAGQPARRLLFHCVIDYKGVAQLSVLLPVKHTIFVLVISLEIEVRVQWFLVTHHRQQQQQRQHLAKVLCQPHHTDNTDHREHPAVGLIQVKLSTSQRRKLD